MRAETEQPRQTVSSHDVADQAIGMVVAEMPPEIAAALEDALDRHGPHAHTRRRHGPGSRARPSGHGLSPSQRTSVSSSSRSRSKQPLSSRDTCICEMPSCWAIRLCVIPRKNRR